MLDQVNSLGVSAQNPRSLAPEFVHLKADITRFIDLQRGKGLEVGPFDNPFFEKTEADVAYLDYRSVEESRAAAAAAIALGHSPDFVVDIDYLVPGSGDWSAVPDGAFDWVLSSHALEHTPNLIGFLKTIISKLVPGGLIITMLPDKRRTFDAYRPLTTLGKIIDDYVSDMKRPSFQSVFDQMFYTRPLSVDAAQSVHSSSGLGIIEGGDFKASLTEALRSRETYVDAHNYVFTDASFDFIMRQVCSGGLLDLEAIYHQPTLDGEMTFLNIMRKLA